MLTNLVLLHKSRELIWAWTLRTIRGRYQQSVLGWLWAVVQPAASVAMLSIIFTLIIPVDTGDIPYPVFSYVAMVPWAFFASSLTDMSTSMIQNMNLVTKIYFPREALPLAGMLSRLMDFAIAIVLLFILMLIYQMPFSPASWIYLPAILAIQVILVVGIGLAAAAFNVFFRDVQPLLTLVLQLWFYATPIIYPISLIPEHYRIVYLINPMVGIIESYRSVFLKGYLPVDNLAIAALTSFIIFIAGYWSFKRLEFTFADIV
jgi:lipopolysaccharide transport system permease protein